MFIIYSCLILVFCSLKTQGQTCTCGKEVFNTRIVGGNITKPNTRLWVAALINTQENNAFCGGSLINDKYILTAAHCLVPYIEDEIKVGLGLLDLTNTDNLETIYNVESMIIHPFYRQDDPYQLFDIGLIKLDRDVEFTNKIQPICLPDKTMELIENKKLLVFGWGKTSEDGEYSDQLREASLPYVKNEDCIESYSSQLITNDHICAGKDKIDSCYGDSGGPLVLYENGVKAYQVGIVSWGVECGSTRPGVYTRITSFLEWIESETQDAVKCE